MCDFPNDSIVPVWGGNADIALIADGQFGAKYFAHKVESE